MYSILSLFKHLILFASGTLAAGAGVGGGAVYTILFIILYGLVYEAIPLSKVTVFGTSVVFFLLHYHLERKNKPFIKIFAFDVIMIMEPATLLGTVYGVIAARMLPYWLITLLMSALLSFSAKKTLTKAKRLYQQENATLKEIEPLINKEEKQKYESLEEEEKDEVVYQWGSDDPRLINIGTTQRAIVTLVVCFISVVTLSIFQLTEYDPCGTPQYFISIIFVSLLTFYLAQSNISYLVKSLETKEKNLPAIDIEKTRDLAWHCTFLCVCAGFLSSLCGIGGSTVKGPLLLHLGVDPLLARSTSQFMLLSTVGASAIQFTLEGLVPQEMILPCLLLGGSAAVAGRFGVDWLVKQMNGRKSIVVALLGGYIVLAVILMTGVGIVIIAGQVLDGIDANEIGFRGVCDETPSDLSALKLIYKSEP
eukprot:snap_masked-scaffold_44-processed-gene-0.42-mRNA-1 protein AED:1.00 eAED:1.00 QI:0/-1/0/0/-1/1/1/0/421